MKRWIYLVLIFLSGLMACSKVDSVLKRRGPHAPEAGAATAKVDATAIETLTLTDLSGAQSACAAATDLGSVACNTAIAKYCVAHGFVTGFGPLDFAAQKVSVLCFAAADAEVVKSGSFNKLAQDQSSCSSSAPVSLPCESAINKACVNDGYAGGWGPIDQQGDTFTYFCTKTASPTASVPTTQPFDALRLYDNAGCDTPFNPLSASCLSAAHNGCVDHGFLGGYGPVDYDATQDTGKAICIGPHHSAVRPFLSDSVAALASYNDPSLQVPTKLSQSVALDDPANPTAPQVYSRPIGQLAFSRFDNNNGTAPCNVPNACFGITAVNLDLGNAKVSGVSKIFTPEPGGTVVGDPAMPDGKLVSGYDPFSMVYGGKVWVAFECTGTVTDNTFSACMGVYDPKSNAIAPSSIYVLAQGVPTPQDATFDGVTVPVTYSASVPKLLHHKGRLFAYWSVITIGPDTNDASGKPVLNFLSVQERGIELKAEPASGRLLPVDSSGNFIGGHLSAIDSRTVAVFNPPDPRGAADTSDVVSDGDAIYVISSIGYANGCTSPYDTISTTNPPVARKPFSASDWPVKCYVPAVSVATDPLTTDAFAKYKIMTPQAGAYLRFYTLPASSGAKNLIGIIGNFPWGTNLGVVPSQNIATPLPF